MPFIKAIFRFLYGEYLLAREIHFLSYLEHLKLRAEIYSMTKETANEIRILRRSISQTRKKLQGMGYVADTVDVEKELEEFHQALKLSKTEARAAHGSNIRSVIYNGSKYNIQYERHA